MGPLARPEIEILGRDQCKKPNGMCIKSVAGAASWICREPSDDGWACGRQGQLGSPGFLDFDLSGGCASSRLDHSLKVLSCTLMTWLIWIRPSLRNYHCAPSLEWSDECYMLARKQANECAARDTLDLRYGNLSGRTNSSAPGKYLYFTNVMPSNKFK